MIGDICFHPDDLEGSVSEVVNTILEIISTVFLWILSFKRFNMRKIQVYFASFIKETPACIKVKLIVSLIVHL